MQKKQILKASCFMFRTKVSSPTFSRGRNSITGLTKIQSDQSRWGIGFYILKDFKMSVVAIRIMAEDISRFRARGLRLIARWEPR